MIERDGYPAGVPCWVDIEVPDPETALLFYSGLFGWEFDDSTPPGSSGRYFVARLRGATVAGAGHASATGRHDDIHLLYIRTRGFPEEEARGHSRAHA
jgi:predicted enzyme related to lactoylglutathione lyase